MVFFYNYHHTFRLLSEDGGCTITYQNAGTSNKYCRKKTEILSTVNTFKSNLSRQKCFIVFLVDMYNIMAKNKLN